MKLTIEMTDEELSCLKQLLQIRCDDFDSLISRQNKPAIDRERLASRIIHARKVLSLSVAKSECCFDYKTPE